MTEPAAGCYWCAGGTDYHPSCDYPGCDRPTHGRGSDGTTTDAYCPACRGAGDD